MADFDALWDYNYPEETEREFTSLLGLICQIIYWIHCRGFSKKTWSMRVYAEEAL